MKNINLFFLLFTLHGTITAGTVYFIPSSDGMNDQQLFNEHDRDGCALHFCALHNAILKQGHHCTVLPNDRKYLDDCWFISCDIPSDSKILEFLARYPTQRCILLLWEPPSVKSYNYSPALHAPFGAIFTMFHETMDNVRYFPLYYPQPFLCMVESSVPFKQKKLCTLIACDKYSHHPDELYSQRRAAIQFFEKNAPQDFDFYGIGWKSHYHHCYKGPIAHKLPYLAEYKFAICYENMKSKTYITEKIFDVLHAGCVPVYWGAREIAHYIPQQAYILRENFSSDQELYTFLQAMPEAEYQNYLNAGKAFFASEYAAKFSIPNFVQSIMTLLFDKPIQPENLNYATN